MSTYLGTRRALEAGHRHGMQAAPLPRQAGPGLHPVARRVWDADAQRVSADEVNEGERRGERGDVRSGVAKRQKPEFPKQIRCLEERRYHRIQTGLSLDWAHLHDTRDTTRGGMR